MTKSPPERSEAQYGRLWDRLASAVARSARPLDLLARSKRAAAEYEMTQAELAVDIDDLCAEIMTRVPPHERIYRPDTALRDDDGALLPYLLRWHLRPKQTGRNEFALYLHRFLQPDDSVLHDHPWPSASWLLFGEQFEVWKAAGDAPGTPSRQLIVPGSLVLRPARHAHCLGLAACGADGWTPATTLFATGQRVRDWGFWPNGNFVPEAEYQQRYSAALSRDAA